MVYVPKIAKYKGLYIQAFGDTTAHNTTEWGLVAKTNPYPLLPTPKTPHKNEWKDVSGDEEWCDKMVYNSIEVTFSFYVKTFDSITETSEQILRKQVDSFFEKICNGEFMFYDSYTGIGRQRVRYAGYTEKEFKRRGNWTRAIFDIKFKVNDPITRMELQTLQGKNVIKIANG